MQTQSFDLHDMFQRVWLEIRASWRYRWHALIVAWCVAVVGAVLVFSIPNQYEASAQVYADTAALTNPLLSGVAVQPDVRRRLQIMTHTLLSRPNLEKVADQTGLSLRATTPTDKVDLLDALGSSVKIRDAGAKNLYDISYSDVDPAMAQKVVQAFLQILMNETLGANTDSTATAQQFLQQQVADYNQRLNAAEQALAQYKKAHVGFIPDNSGGSYASRLQNAESRLDALQAQYDTALAGRATIQRQMRSMATNPGSSGIVPQTRQINEQIAAYRQKLNKLLLSYTDAYPDVVSTRRMIKQLEARRENLENNTTNASLAGLATDNPVYQERQNSLYATQVSIRTLGSQIAQQKQLIAELKGKQATSMDVETTLQRLTRNYTTTKNQYNELVARLNTAQISQAAMQSGNNLKFRVVNPPIVPLLPSSPKRGLLLLIVFVFAIGFGAAFAFFLQKIKPVFTSLQSLRGFAEYPVMGAIQLIESRARRVDKRREVIGFCTGVSLLGIALVLCFAYNGPLANTIQHIFVAGVS
ncbi:MAG TPA: XrtA system polysaccharide chain length determinant [Oleiagrimonas sp.]|nr:XrtA system polysaccharide chain length determinant [Oleiagrimonas sp.]